MSSSRVNTLNILIYYSLLGPTSFEGELGKIMATDVWLLPVGKFNPIKANFPEIDNEV